MRIADVPVEFLVFPRKDLGEVPVALRDPEWSSIRVAELTVLADVLDLRLRPAAAGRVRAFWAQELVPVVSSVCDYSKHVLIVTNGNYLCQA